MLWNSQNVYSRDGLKDGRLRGMALLLTS
jgi:hypothetical protein